MHEFRMPDIGEGLTEAEIVQWHVAVGDRVEADQVIVEVETAKTVVEIPSEFAGTVISIGAAPGDIVAVGDILFTIGSEGDESTSADQPQEPSSQSDAPAAGTNAPPPKVQVPSSAVEHPAQPPSGGRSTVRAMPLVRRLAAERGVDLTTIAGSGPGGAITRADVEAAPAVSPIEGELVPLTPTRRAIAEHMAKSWREIPHVTVQAEIRAESLVGQMRRTGCALEACVAERLLPVLRAFPDFNATFTDKGVVRKPRHDIGFAVDTDAGLMVVVVKDAGEKPLDELNAEFSALAAAAKDRTIGVDQITGQSFTISNIGALGGGHGTPIIPLGTTAIMSIGRATDTPVVTAGAFEVGLVAPIDLSYDHRVIDGGLGQRFLSAATAALEH